MDRIRPNTHKRFGPHKVLGPYIRTINHQPQIMVDLFCKLPGATEKKHGFVGHAQLLAERRLNTDCKKKDVGLNCQRRAVPYV